MEKIELSDLNEAHFERARQICHEIVAMQSEAANLTIGRKTVEEVLKLYSGLSGFYSDLYSDLHSGLDSGLDSGLYSGPEFYCGIHWSYLLCKYKIAQSFGCQFDQDKLDLLENFCRHSPIVIRENQEIKLAKPNKVLWRVTGETSSPFRFPIYQLHSEGETTVECLDIKLYYFNAIKIRERMGTVKSAQWKPEWFLEEENVEVKRLIAEQLGYDEIFEKLNSKKIHSWREYDLYHCDVKPSPIAILGMVCPSTGKKHYDEVPIDVTSAEVAATLRNGGIHPSLFNQES